MVKNQEYISVATRGSFVAKIPEFYQNLLTNDYASKLRYKTFFLSEAGKIRKFVINDIYDNPEKIVELSGKQKFLKIGYTQNVDYLYLSIDDNNKGAIYLYRECVADHEQQLIWLADDILSFSNLLTNKHFEIDDLCTDLDKKILIIVSELNVSSIHSKNNY